MMMNEVKLLDCTLRDGGYINNWDFTEHQIKSTISNLTNANIDYVEIGYLTSITGDVNGSQFQCIESASKLLPNNRKKTKYVIMVDVAQFDIEELCPRSKDTLDGIRVVFYKRQIDLAHVFCDRVREKGYDLFIQPMVTVDYSAQEFSELASRFYNNYQPYSIAIVDSFGCMNATMLNSFVEMIRQNTGDDVRIGFHGHDNMQLTQINAASLINCANRQKLIIDATVSGIGRGAGNLYTELIANYCNFHCNSEYNLNQILQVASEVTEPLSRKFKWGYSPYLMLTAMHHAHPNYATYLLANHDVSVSEFADFINSIPDDMLTKCTRPYVEELYKQFK